MLIEIAAGELVDRLTIARLKSERMRDPAKRALALAERARLGVQLMTLPQSPELWAFFAALYTTNATLWDIENELRMCERAGEFDTRFIQLARAVYQHNDRRCALKCSVDRLLSCELHEVKEYAGQPDLATSP